MKHTKLFDLPLGFVSSILPDITGYEEQPRIARALVSGESLLQVFGSLSILTQDVMRTPEVIEIIPRVVGIKYYPLLQKPQSIFRQPLVIPDKGKQSISIGVAGR